MGKGGSSSEIACCQTGLLPKSSQLVYPLGEINLCRCCVQKRRQSGQAHKAFVTASLASPIIATMHNPAYETPGASKNVPQFTFDRRDSTC